MLEKGAAVPTFGVGWESATAIVEQREAKSTTYGQQQNKKCVSPGGRRNWARTCSERQPVGERPIKKIPSNLGCQYALPVPSSYTH